jgi:hypothetical protein
LSSRVLREEGGTSTLSVVVCQTVEEGAGMGTERPQGAFSRGMLEKDIAHVQMLLPISLVGQVSGQLLDSAYWRRRLYQILRQDHLSKSNLQSVDALLAILDQFDSAHSEMTSM